MGNKFSVRTIRIYPSGGRDVEAHTPFGVMYGEWVSPGDAVLDAGDQTEARISVHALELCCYGQRSTGVGYVFCRVFG